MEKVLKASKEFDVRFSKVDSMNIVWHGSYALYFEDAREEFERVFGLSYHEYIANEYFAPLVDLNFQYKKPLLRIRKYIRKSEYRVRFEYGERPSFHRRNRNDFSGTRISQDTPRQLRAARKCKRLFGQQNGYHNDGESG